jgi:hypothetical protein
MRQSRNALRPWLDQALILRNNPVGFVDGEPVYPIRGAEGENTGEGEGGTGSGGDGGGSGTGNADNDDDDDDDEKPPKDPKQYQEWAKNRQLRKENANRRAKNKELAEELAAKNKELEELKAKDMSDLEKANSALAKLTKTTEEQAAALEEARIKIAFLEIPGDKYTWQDPGAALTLLMTDHRGELSLNDDGTVDGMDKAVKALAKRYQWMLKTPGSGAGEEGEGKGSTGGSYGSNGDRGSGDARKAFQEQAAKRFSF